MKKTNKISSHPFVPLTEGGKLRPLEDVMQDVFLHAVEFCAGNKTQAADGLEMGRSTFYRKMGAQRELLSQLHREKQMQENNLK